MSLLVHYTLKSADDHDQQVQAMHGLVAGLKAQNVPVSYACFKTDDPLKFVGVLEFDSDADKQAFLDCGAFAEYRAAVTPIFANPPEAQEISAIASTRS